MKSTMFIGSCVEGLKVAEAILGIIKYETDVTLWTQGIFDLSSNTLDSLTEQLTKFDFATFVLSPDDAAKMRDEDVKIPRDNVLFELGLFIGALGKGRVFFVIPEINDFHIPTDLLGITPATYRPDSHSGNISASLGDACTQIKNSISKRLNPAQGISNLSGKWVGYWEVISNNFPVKNQFETEIKQIESKITSSFLTNDILYPISGEIHRGGLITGMWGSPENGASYFGPFQLIVSPCGKKLKGKWSGFSSTNTVQSGEFYWERV